MHRPEEADQQRRQTPPIKGWFFAGPEPSEVRPKQSDQISGLDVGCTSSSRTTAEDGGRVSAAVCSSTRCATEEGGDSRRDVAVVRAATPTVGRRQGAGDGTEGLGNEEVGGGGRRGGAAVSVQLASTTSADDVSGACTSAPPAVIVGPPPAAVVTRTISDEQDQPIKAEDEYELSKVRQGKEGKVGSEGNEEEKLKTTDSGEIHDQGDEKNDPLALFQKRRRETLQFLRDKLPHVQHRRFTAMEYNLSPRVARRPQHRKRDPTLIHYDLAPGSNGRRLWRGERRCGTAALFDGTANGGASTPSDLKVRERVEGGDGHAGFARPGKHSFGRSGHVISGIGSDRWLLEPWRHDEDSVDGTPPPAHRCSDGGSSDRENRDLNGVWVKKQQQGSFLLNDAVDTDLRADAASSKRVLQKRPPKASDRNCLSAASQLPSTGDIDGMDVFRVESTQKDLVTGARGSIPRAVEVGRKEGGPESPSERSETSRAAVKSDTSLHALGGGEDDGRCMLHLSDFLRRRKRPKRQSAHTVQWRSESPASTESTSASSAPTILDSSASQLHCQPRKRSAEPVLIAGFVHSVARNLHCQAGLASRPAGSSERPPFNRSKSGSSSAKSRDNVFSAVTKNPISHRGATARKAAPRLQKLRRSTTEPLPSTKHERMLSSAASSPLPSPTTPSSAATSSSVSGSSPFVTKARLSTSSESRQSRWLSIASQSVELPEPKKSRRSEEPPAASPNACMPPAASLISRSGARVIQRARDSADVVRKSRANYIPYFKDIDVPTVVLEYPGEGADEDFLLMVPAADEDKDEYNPLEDISATVEAVSMFYVDERTSLRLFGTHQEGLLRRFTRARNRREGKLLLEAVREFNAIIRLLRHGEAQNAKNSGDEEDTPLAFVDNFKMPNGEIDLHLVKHVLYQVYSRTVAPQADSLQQYKAFSNNVYGEVNSPLVDEFIRRTGIRSDGCFVDLGCGIGNVVLHVAAQTGADSYGIEIMEIPSRLALLQLKEFKSRMRYWGLPHGTVEIWKGDFLTSPEIVKVLRRADVLFVNNYAFDQHLNQGLLQLFLELKDTVQIISLKAFVPESYKITSRNASSPASILKVKRYQYFSGAVSWTNNGGDYYIHTIDREPLAAFHASLLR